MYASKPVGVAACGVVGVIDLGPLTWDGVTKRQGSGTALEKPAIEGKSPVCESLPTPR
jgi:hypothetical protein